MEQKQDVYLLMQQEDLEENMEENSGVKKSVPRRIDLDPIEWAIVAVIVAGLSLLLSLETKAEARKRSEVEEITKKAIGSNKLKLWKIKQHIKEIQSLFLEIHEIGETLSLSGKRGINSSSIKFNSEEDQEAFNDKFDRITYLISRVNRLINGIDPQGIFLSDSDIAKNVIYPINRLNEKMELCINPELDISDRFKNTDALLHNCFKFIDDLESVL